MRKIYEKMEGTSSGLMRQAWFDYDSAGNLIREEYSNNNPDDPTNPVTRREYYANGNLWKVHDPNGNPPTIYEYDPATETYPEKITNALGHYVEYEYDYRYGKVSAEKNANGNWTDYYYDSFGRLERVDFPDGGQVLTEYNDDVFPRYVVSKVKEDTAGNTIDSYQYFDGLGRTIQTISLGEAGKTIVTKALYDNMGRNYRTEGPFFSTLIVWPIATPADSPYAETTFDERGRPVEVKAPLGQDVEQGSLAVTKFSYSGLSTTVEDPDGGKKTEINDYLGRVVQVTEYSDTGELYTGYHYNAAGDLLDLTDAMGNVTSMSYDSLGRKISMTDPDMGYWKYTYDANGNLITQTDAKGHRIKFNYDAINRVDQKEYLDTPESKIDYDFDIGINGIGRLYSVSNGAGSTEYDEYDSMGQVLSVTRSITGAPLSAYTTTYSYDLSGKVKSMTYPGITPYQVNYDYHPGSGLLYTVTGITDFTEYAELTEYEPSGKIGEIYHGNGAQTFYTYDPKSTRLLSIQTVGSGLEDVQDKAYKYTAAGDIARITDTKNAQNITYSYAYDKLHRLIAETNTGGSDDFDPSMLIKTFDDTAPIHAVKSINFNGKAHAYEYDKNGNMILSWDFTDPSQPVERQIDFNADNMPVQIRHMRSSGSVVVGLSYDGAGVRVKKAVQGGSTTYYISDHFEVAGGVEIKYIFAGSLRIAKVTTTQKHFYHKDHLGSTTVITGYSDGSIAETAEYLPFGLFRNQSGTEVTYYKFSDQELDAEVGLYNYNARLYDPAIGIFISPDSIVPDLYDPQTLNRYSYCRNNPLIYTDPSGHLFGIDNLIGSAVGAVIGGVTAAITGGDIWQGIATGAVMGFFTSGASAFMDSSWAMATAGDLVNAGVFGVAGAAAGATNAAIWGQDIGQGALYGGVFGAAASFGTPNFTPFGDSAAGSMANRFVNSSLTGAGFGAAYAGITGGDIGQGAARGALGWAAGRGANMLIGHGLGYVISGKGPEFNNGAFYYYKEGQTPFTIGGAIIGDEDYILGYNRINGRWDYNHTTDQHERAHFPQQTALSISYIPAHIASQGVSGILSGFDFKYGTHRYNIFERWWINVPSY